MRTDMNRLRGKMRERKITQKGLAEKLGINNSTFIRKMNAEGLSFTVEQLHGIALVLGLSADEARDIFLLQNSHL